MNHKSPLLAAALCLVLHAGVAAIAQTHPVMSPHATLRYVVKSPVARASNGAAAGCQDTWVDEARMAYFLKHAAASTGTNYSRALVQGDCSAEGFVIVNERKAYRLTIDSASGWGAIESGPSTTYLYCEKCEGLLERDFGLTQ